MGKRNHDKWAVPLCARHHRDHAGSLHKLGDEVKWFLSHDINYQVELATGLWRRRGRFGEMLEFMEEVGG